jgi:chloride channel protein, CIC family
MRASVRTAKVRRVPGEKTVTASAGSELTPDQAAALISSRRYMALLVLAAIVGLVVSLAAWCFLEGTFQLQQLLFDDIPDSLGYEADPPLWYLLVVLGAGGLIVAYAIARLPGRGGHIPVHGLQAGGPAGPVELPGILLAAVGTIGFGLVLGPEAPLIALGAGLAILTFRATRRDAPDEVLVVIAAAGSFAAVSFIFASPFIAAVLLIEATGLGGARQRIILLPGLLAAGIGSLVSIGAGALSGLSTSDYALGALALPQFDQPVFGDFAWTIALSVVVAVVVQLAVWLGRRVERYATPQPLLLPLVGLVVAALAYAFGKATDKSAVTVLLSGQDALPGLVSDAGAWSVATLALLIVCKGLAYAASLGSFRGGPTFPALFLGAAAGVMASHLPGLSLTPAVAVCMAAATVSMLRLPLSAAILAILLTSKSGAGAEPLIIVAVVVAMIVTLILAGRESARSKTAVDPE